MNKRRFFISMLVLIACCLFLVPARTVFADETTTHIEGTVSFDDDNNSRGQRPDSVPIIVATRVADKPSYGDLELDFGGTKTQKLCYVSDATNWKYDADIPTVDEDGNALVPVVSVVYSSVASTSELPPYAVSKNGYDFLMTYRPHTFDVNIVIKWDDANNVDRVRPSVLHGAIWYPGAGQSVAMTTLWKSQVENTAAETDCTFENQKLYGQRYSYNDGLGYGFSICGTFANWIVSLDLGGTELVNGSTVTDNNYSYTMTEHVDKDNVPSYEIVAVHKPKTSNETGSGTETGGGTETDNKPGSSIPDNQKPSDQVKPASDEKKKDEKKDGKATSKPNQQSSALPKTGDISTAVVSLFVAVGVTLTFLGISLKRR